MLVAQERRTGPRAPLTGTAVVHCGDAKLACEILDVAAMGIGVMAPRELSAGQFVRVVFRIGAANGPERLHQADGVVVGASKQPAGCRLGIQFTVIEGPVAASIHKYIARTVGAVAPRRRTDAYATIPGPVHTPPATGEFPAADEPEPTDEVEAATGTDGEDQRGLSGLPIRGPERDAPIDRELLQLYLDAIRTVDSKRKRS